MYKKYIFVILLSLLVYIITPKMFRLIEKVQSKNNNRQVVITDFYQYTNNRSKFYLRIKNETNDLLKPNIKIIFVRNFKRVEFPFADVNTFGPLEGKDAEIELKSDWGPLNINNVEVEVSKDKVVLAKASKYFVNSNIDKVDRGLVLLTSITVTASLLFIRSRI